MRWMFIEQTATAPWSPSDLASLSAWYDASDSTTVFDTTTGGSLPADDGDVARIEDKSGSGFHLTQATAGNRPVRVAAEQNSLDALSFTRTNVEYLERGTTAIARGVGGVTIAAVYKEASASGSGNIAHIAVGTGNGARVDLVVEHTENSIYAGGRRLDGDTYALASAATQALTNQTWYTAVAVHDFANSNLSVFVDGTSVAENTSYKSGGNTSDTDANSMAIGTNTNATSTYALGGMIGEVVIVDAVLSQSDRQKLEGYLAHKWGLTAGLDATHPHKSSAP